MTTPDNTQAGPALLPCPFCGGPADIVPDRLEPTSPDHVYVMCQACDVYAPGDESTRAGQIERWNRRPPADPERGVKLAKLMAATRLGDGTIRAPWDHLAPEEKGQLLYEAHLALGCIAQLEPPPADPSTIGQVRGLPTREEVERAIESAMRPDVHREAATVLRTLGYDPANDNGARFAGLWYFAWQKVRPSKDSTPPVPPESTREGRWTVLEEALRVTVAALESVGKELGLDEEQGSGLEVGRAALRALSTTSETPREPAGSERVRALEEAAKVCDRLYSDGLGGAQLCAEAIRSLASTPSETPSGGGGRD